MFKTSRREFLARTAATAGAVALGTQHISATLAADAGPAAMAIAKWKDPATLSGETMKQAAVKLTEAAMQAIGGMGRFVGRGDVVWVKPNIGWDRAPELAANTNPDVVATIVRMCFDAGAKKVYIGDNPCDLAAKTYKSSGIADAVAPLGAEVRFLDTRRTKDTAIKGERVKSLAMWPEILDCDLVINAPIVKHHGLAGATMCMKNYMGVMDNRRPFHQALPACLVDLTGYMKPRLCILDAMRILTAHGPKGGNPQDVAVKGTVAAGVDIVALDAWGAEVMGHKPADFPSITAGQEAGLGKIDYRSLALKELTLS